MDFLFYLFKYFPFGGLQRNCAKIAEACVTRGHSVHVFTSRWDAERPDGLEITEAPVRHLLTNIGRERALLRKLEPHLKERSYDCVVGFNRMPGADIYYSGDPCFVTQHAARGALYRLSRRYRLRAAWERAMFGPGSDTDVLIVGARQKAEYQDAYDLSDERIHLLPPNVDCEAFRPENHPNARQDVIAEFALPEDALVLLMVCSRFRTKGLDRAIDAMAALPEPLRNRTHLLAVGDDRADAYRARAHQKGLEKRVHFAGGRSDVARLCCAADLLVHPARMENTGTVLLEAMAAGLPVLTSGVPGYAGYVEDAEAGRVLPEPFEQGALNGALATMLASDEDRQCWARNARDYCSTADFGGRYEAAADIIVARAERNRATRERVCA